MAFQKVMHVEIHQKEDSTLDPDTIKESVKNYLKREKKIVLRSVFSGTVLPDHVKCFRVYVDEEFNGRDICKSGEKIIDVTNKIIRYYVYRTCSTCPEYDGLNDGGGDNNVSFLSWSLPHSNFEGMWDTLIFEDDIKDRLLRYSQTILLYYNKNVSTQIIKWNGMILLHGPPGTGKTTLCKALAQKLSIRLKDKFASGHLIEINIHSLFSKWYSESPKRVFETFSEIQKLLEFKENYVCLLMDEVESLVRSRQSNGSEPYDSIRVVNTVLTQLDQLQGYKNLLIMATSNVKDCIDHAFFDRADLKIYLGYPKGAVITEILTSTFDELIRCGLITKSSNYTDYGYQKIMELSKLCSGLSGRLLRKAPLLAYTEFVNKDTPSFTEFFISLREVIIKMNEGEGIDLPFN